MSTFLKKIIKLKETAQSVIVVLLILSFVAIDLPTPIVAEAAINKQINYQGKLTNLSNIAVTDGSYNMSFSLYTASSGGTAIWTENKLVSASQGVSVANGLFSTMLGSVSSLANVDFNQTLYLGVTIGGTGMTPTWDSEMSPRKIIGSVPSAMVADTLQGLNPTQFFRSDAANSTSTTNTYFSITNSGAGNIADFIGQSGARALTVKSNGNVGVGTTSAASTLTVGGSACITEGTAICSTAAGTLSFTSQSSAIYMPRQSGGVLRSIVWNGSNQFNFGSQFELNNYYVNGGTIYGAANFNTAANFSATSGTTTIASGQGFTVGSTQFVVQQGSGNVGVGVANPSLKFVVNGDMGVSSVGQKVYLGDPANTLYRNGNGNTMVDYATDFQLNSYYGGGVKFTVTQAGNVGIGTTSPWKKLSVSGDLSLTGALFDSTSSAGTNGMVLQTTGSGTQWVATSSLGFASASQIGAGTQGYLPFYNATGSNLTATSSIFISQSGNIGVGTTTTNKKLTVGGGIGIDADTSGYGLYFTSGLNPTGVSLTVSGGNKDRLQISGSTLVPQLISPYNSGSNFSFVNGDIITMSTNSSERFRITNTGNIGIGSSSPLAKLSVTGAGTGTGISFQTTNSSNAPMFTVLDNGNVGIATGTPGSVLPSYFYTATGNSVSFEVNSRGVVSDTGLFIRRSDGVSGLDIVSHGSCAFGSYSNCDTTFNNRWGGSAYRFLVGGSEKLTLTSGGNLGIGTTSPYALLSLASSTGQTTQGIAFGNQVLYQDSTGNLTSSAIITSNTSITGSNNTGAIKVGGVGGSATFSVGGAAAGITTGGSFTLTASGGSISLNSGGGAPVFVGNNGLSIGATSFSIYNKLDVNGGTAIGTYANTVTAPSNGLIVSGNVGIGTSSPSQLLSVGGNGYVTGGLGIGVVNTTAGTLVTSGNAQITGQLRVGDNSSGYIYAVDSAHSIQLRQGGADVTRLTEYGGTLATGKGIFFNVGGSDRLQIGSDGINSSVNFGIGTTSPGSALSVTGNGYFTGGITVGPSVIGSGSGYTYITNMRTDGTTIGVNAGTGVPAVDSYTYGTMAFRNQFGGISLTGGESQNAAVSSGQFTFTSITPTLNQSGTAGYTALLINPTETTTGSGSKYLIDAQVGGSSKFVLTNAGNVGIGTTSPSEKLEIAGNILFSTGANRTIGIATTSGSGTAASLTISAQGSSSGSMTGGDLTLYAGGSFAAPGNVNISGGANNYINNRGGSVYLFGGSAFAGSGNVSLGINSAGTQLGNVGVGTTSPWKKFSVSGDMVLTGVLFDSLSSAGTNGMILQTTGSGTQWVATSSLGFASASQIGAGTQGQFPFYNAAGSNLTATSSLFISQAGYIGIGTQSPTTPLTIVSPASGAYGLTIISANASDQIFAGKTNTNVTNSYINASGNAGFNGLLNAGSLTVNGGGSTGVTINGTNYGQVLAQHAEFTNGGNAALVPLISRGSSSQTGNLQEWQNSSSAALSVVTANGSFGIGTTSPSGNLAVTGTIDNSNTFIVGRSGYNSLTIDAVGRLYTGSYAGTYSSLDAGMAIDGRPNVPTLITKAGTSATVNQSWRNTSNTEVANISAAGGAYFASNVGIGTTSPAATLSVAGNGYITGSLGLGVGPSGTSGKMNFLGGASIDGSQTIGSGQNDLVISSPDYLALTGGQVLIKDIGSGNYALSVSSTEAWLRGPKIVLQDNGGNSSIIASYGKNIVLDPNAYTSGYHTVINSGNLGVGTSSPYAKLSVAGETVAANFTATSSTATSTFNGAINIATTAVGGPGIISQNGSRFLHSFGTNSLFLGANSGNLTNSGTVNIGIGANTLTGLTNGSDNVAIGSGAGAALNSGINNMIMGYLSAENLDTGANNVILGHAAGRQLSGASSGNIALGTQSLYGNFGQVDNTVAIGHGAGLNITTGDNNILLGYQAGDNLTTGTKNIIIGYNIDAPAVSSTNILNIGNLIYGTTLDGSGTTLSTGRIGIGTTTPGATFAVNGTGYFTGATTIGGLLTVNGTGTSTMTSSLAMNSAQAIYFNGSSDNNWRIGRNTGGLTGSMATGNSIDIVIDPGFSTNQGFRVGANGSSANFEVTGGSNGNVYVKNNLGIGTTSPYAKLSVVGTVVGQNFVATSNTASNFPYASSTALTVSGALYNSALTSGRITYAGTNGVLTDSSSMTFNGTQLQLDPNSSSSSGALIIKNTAATSNSTYIGLDYGNSIISGANTGDFSISSGGNIGFSANSGSSLQLAIKSNGFVGIGTTTPFGQLSVNPNGLTGPAFVVGSSTATNLIVTNSGNVGIGTALPGTKLTVNGTTTIGSPFTNGVTFSNNTILNLGGDIQFGRGATRSISVNGGTLDSNGNNFQIVAGAGGGLDFNAGTNGGNLYLAGGAKLGTGTDGNVLLGYNGTSFVGNVGIGTSSPWKKFSVVGDMVLTGGLYDSLSSAGTNGMVLQTTGSATKWVATSSLGFASASQIGAGTQGQFAFYNASGTNLSATSSIFASQTGNIGIGTTSPGSKLSVAGNGYITGTLNVGSSITSSSQVITPSIYGLNTLNISSGGSMYIGGNNQSVNFINDLGGETVNFDVPATFNADIYTSNNIIGGTLFAPSDYNSNTPGVIGIGDYTSLQQISWALNYDGSASFANGASYITSVGDAHFGQWDITGDLMSNVAGYLSASNIESNYFNAKSGGYYADFTGDNYMRFPGSNSIAFATNNVDALMITSAGNVGIGTTSPYAKLSVAGTVVGQNFISTSTATSSFMGAVGIGTAAPSTMLHVKNSSTGINTLLTLEGGVSGVGQGAALSFTNLYGPAGRIRSAAGNGAGLSDLVFEVNNSNTEVMRILTSGNVGIGISAPSSKLHVAADNSSGLTPQFLVTGKTNANQGITVGYNTSSSLAAIQSLSNISSGTGSALLLNPLGGSVGIGVNGSPSAKLHINSSATSDVALLLGGQGQSGGSDSSNGVTFRLGYNGSGNRQLWLGDSAQANNASYSSFRYVVGFDIPMIDAVSNDGNTRRNVGIGSDQTNVGIGVNLGTQTQSSITAKLHVFDEASKVGLAIDGASSQSANYMNITSNGGSAGNILSVNSAGNVGIGTTSPYSKLSVSGRVVAANFVGTTTSLSTLAGGLTVSGAVTANSTFTANSLANFNSIFTQTMPSSASVPSFVLTNTKGDGNIFEIYERGRATFTNNSNQTGFNITAAGNGVYQNVLAVTQPGTWTGTNYALSVSGYSDLGGFRVNGADAANSIYASNGGSMGFSVNGGQAITFAISPYNEKMRIASNGFLGIGTTSPASTLSVGGNGYVTGGLGIGTTNSTSGTLAVQSSSYVSNQVLISDGVTSAPPAYPGSLTPALSVQVSEVSGSRPLFFGYRNGNAWDGTIDIGACGAFSQMCFNMGQGTSHYTSLVTNSNNLAIGGNSNATGFSAVDGNYNNVYFGNTGNIYMPNGYLGVGTNSASYRLSVKGTGTGSTKAFVVTNSSNVDTFSVQDDGSIVFPQTQTDVSISIPGRFGGGGSVGGSLTLQAGTALAGSAGSGGGSLLLKAGDAYTGGAETAGDVKIYAGQNTYTNSQHGSIRFYAGNTQPEVLTILPSGNVGVGTTSPASKLTVVGSACISGGAGSTAACSTTAGTITARVFNTANADLAENYQTTDTTIAAGDIVAVDFFNDESIVKATSTSVIMGIVSTNPGMLLGADEGNSYLRPVALSGRVPVKVSVENGAINRGDSLTISRTQPGVAVKYIGIGQVIGTALSTATNDGKVTVFVRANLQTALADSIANTESMSMNTSFTDLLAAAAQSSAQWIGQRVVANLGVFHYVKTDTLDADTVNTKNLCIDGVCISKDQFKSLLAKNGIGVTEASVDESTPSPSPTPTPSVTPSVSPTPSATPSPSPSQEVSSTPSSAVIITDAPADVGASSGN